VPAQPGKSGGHCPICDQLTVWTVAPIAIDTGYVCTNEPAERVVIPALPEPNRGSFFLPASPRAPPADPLSA
jgi:hypothetical protein